ncbi:hypothetical protein M0R04_08340 [Candidatus Dojkabacteria bacterium]|jgi:hypothetical protein|nr:hypothetical protein [Candidatus Dojkabacteria bacterium]
MAKLKQTLNCGCIVAVDYNDMVMVIYCPKHNAVADMYEVCKRVYDVFVNNKQDDLCLTNTIMCQAADAIAKAEGRK